MGLHQIIESLINEDADLSVQALKSILFSSVDDVVHAADAVGESADYVLEAALEKAATLQLDQEDVVERIRSYWLQLEYVAGGTIYEIVVRSAEFLAGFHRRQGWADDALERGSKSADWRERLVCAWYVRDATDALSQRLRAALTQDAFQDDDGIFLIREGAGHYED